MNTTLEQFIAGLPQTNSQLIDWNDQEFYTWQSENIQNGGYAPSGTRRRDRYNRVHEAAEHGCDGSTHGENIQDFREWCGEVFRRINRDANHLDITEAEAAHLDGLIKAAHKACIADIDACEDWHVKNGSINQQGA